jgi:hypothetical protein
MGPSKTPNKAERAWMSRIVEHGCVACRKDGHYFEPAQVHHITSGFRRMGHLFSLPLCEAHHTGTDGDRPSVHGAKRSFERRYGAQLDLLSELQVELGVYDEVRA